MSLEVIKGAIIKRSRSITNLLGGRLFIYRDMSILYPDNKSILVRSVLISHYMVGQLQLKKPYRIFMVPVRIPVLVFQNGYFIARSAQCLFALYDGRDMREDVENTIKALKTYRQQVLITSIVLIALAVFLSAVGGVWVIVALMIMAWFAIVAVFALILSVGNLQSDMEELVDLDRNNWEAPPPIKKPQPAVDAEGSESADSNAEEGNKANT